MTPILISRPGKSLSRLIQLSLPIADRLFVAHDSGSTPTGILLIPLTYCNNILIWMKPIVGGGLDYL